MAKIIAKFVVDSDEQLSKPMLLEAAIRGIEGGCNERRYRAQEQIDALTKELGEIEELRRKYSGMTW